MFISLGLFVCEVSVVERLPCCIETQHFLKMFPSQVIGIMFQLRCLQHYFLSFLNFLFSAPSATSCSDRVAWVSLLLSEHLTSKNLHQARSSGQTSSCMSRPESESIIWHTIHLHCKVLVVLLIHKYQCLCCVCIVSQKVLSDFI